MPIESGVQTTRFVKQAYYLEPEPIARKAFYLLKQVLAERGLRAIAKIVLRDREQLVAIDPFSTTMVLSTLHWPDEVRSLGELALPEDEVEIKPAERAMAEQLIDAMTSEFDVESYHDEYREALLEIIEAKAAGAEIAQPAAAPAAGVTDLMAALEASVAAAKAARASTAPQPVSAGRKAVASGRRAVAVGPGKPAAAPAAPAAPPEEEAEAVPVRRRKSA